MTIALLALLTLLALALVLWLIRVLHRPVPPAAPSRLRLQTRLGSVFARGLEEATWSELEAALITADVGLDLARRLVGTVRSAGPQSAADARDGLRAAVVALLGERDRSLRLAGDPAVIVVAGVNGSGKTTTIAKLAARLRSDGFSVLVAAADTYRAAATQQLLAWADRLGFEVVKGLDGSDPAAVALDAVRAARSRGRRAVIVDTAGRLHSDRNLMEELGKITRVLEREIGTVDETLLVIDGTTGQNALAQARAFTLAVGVSGIVVTKLDGSARGGFVLAVENELGVPVKFVGSGEGAADLLAFSPYEYADGLLSTS